MRLPGALLVISIVADVGLLLWLIWTFHAQYGQTAPFSLKVPTFVYMFVFIALRVLRFDHRYVMVAGLTAAGGWLVLLAAVLALSEPDAITRNFVHYLSSNTILLGAEFDKVVTILLVTAVLSLAVARGRRLLVTAVREAAAVKDLRRFLGRGVSDRVVGAEIELSAGYAQERDAAIVMLDIRGFTPVSAQLPPAQVVELLIGLHARLIPIVRAHGGIVDKFLGDGVMATFGAVAVSTDAAAQALRALEAIMAEAARWRAELPPDAVTARLEVNGAAVAGLVVFAVLGSADRLEYTVIGEAVNLAAKLEKHNKVQGCRALTTLDTLARAEAQGYVPSARVEPLRACRVAGVAAPLDLAVISV
jgi:adenylate cyclase